MKNFTLIELLVVVAIIGILASLLLPALAGAKAEALRTVCTNSLKQLSYSIQIYSTDNNDQIVPATTANYSHSWDDLLSEIDGRHLSADEVDGFRFDKSDSLRHKFYRCPSSKWGEQDPYVLRSYSMNAGFNSWDGKGVSWQNNSKNFSQIEDSSGTFMLVERDQITYNRVGGGSSSHTWYNMHYHSHSTINLQVHRKKINTAMVDGSVKARSVLTTLSPNMWTSEKDD